MAENIKTRLWKFAISASVLLLLYTGMGVIFEQEVLSSVYGWKFRQGKEEEEIKKAVTLYNKIFIDLYVTDGIPAMLNNFPASKQLRHELYRNIGYLRSNNLVIVYDMADLVFVEIKRPSAMTAEVATYEEWNYIYQKLPSRALAQSIKGMAGGFRYSLIKQGGAWVVVDYAPQDVKVEKKDEFYF